MGEIVAMAGERGDNEIPESTIRSRILSTLEEFVAAEALKEADDRTRLLGAFPELDSMALTEFVTALEETFGIVIDDEDMTERNFETIGAVVRLVAARRRDG